MDKNKLSRGIFDGWLALAFFFFLIATILALLLYLFSDKEGIVKNAIKGSFIFEISILVWMVIHIRKGVVKILEETKNLYVVRDLYNKILYVSLIGAALGMVALLLSLHISVGVDIIYSLNIISFSLIFVIWMCISIYRINRRLRFWLQWL